MEVDNEMVSLIAIIKEKYKAMSEETFKVVVRGVMSDFYSQVMGKRFDAIDAQLTDLRLTTTALVKIVDYARLEAKMIELESRLKKLEA